MNAADIAVSRAAAVLAAAPAALITDIDGTISRIVARPEAAVVSDSARASLRCLAGRLALVAVITAREQAVARRMVAVEELTYVGNYALDSASAPHLGDDPLAEARRAIRPLLRPFSCVTLEEKGVAFSMHYRNCQEEGMRERLLALVQPIADAAAARVLEGKQVIELVPRALPDKGSAVARLAPSAGFAVEVVDDRPEHLEPSAFPPGVRLLATDAAFRDGYTSLSPEDFAVIVTRDASVDADLAGRCAGVCAYVGVMGSQAKRAFMKRQVAAHGVQAEVFEGVRCPMGVDIGADTPEEIAVSVVAEMIATRSSRRGK